MKLFVRTRELYTLEVTGLETVAQIKAHVASLEGLTPEDKIVLLTGSPLQDEATPGQYRVEALTSLEVVGCMLGVHHFIRVIEEAYLRSKPRQSTVEPQDGEAW